MGTVILSGNNTYAGNTIINAGTVQIGSGGASGSLSATSAITDNGTLTFDTSSAQTQGTDFGSAGITGGGSVTQAGSGALVLNAAETYTGATKINAGGTLQLGSGGTGLAGGSLSTNSAITDNGNLTFNRSDTVTQGTDFNGGGIAGGGSGDTGGQRHARPTFAAETYTGGDQRQRRRHPATGQRRHGGNAGDQQRHHRQRQLYH